MKSLISDFPLLKHKIDGHKISYLDNASTTQKPQAVLNALMHFYTTQNANIFRGIHALGERATQAYEDARVRVAKYIGAHDVSEVIFTSGTTESINFIASTWAYKHINSGDEVVVTELEHHANLLPWQRIVEQKGAVLRAIPITHDGQLDMERAAELITKKTKLVAISSCSNAIGTQIDVATIIRLAHAVGARVLIDAAQSIPHTRLDVHALDCDFLAFSGHKMLAPTGIGVLYIKKELHDETPPYQLGGGMVRQADIQHATYLPAPYKFEAGTPPIAQAVGLHAAIDYLDSHINFAAFHIYEADLCRRTVDGLSQIKGITILGPVAQLKQDGHLVSFTVQNIHAHDVAAYLSERGICVRAGNHCAQPLFKKLGVPASVRASFYFYNTVDEIDLLVKAVDELVHHFK